MKQRTDAILFTLMIVAVALLFALPAAAQAEDVFTYTVTGEKATLTHCDNSASGDVTVPETLGGLPVTAIGAYAFEACGLVTSVTLPDTVDRIGEYAFFDCTSLADIEFGEGVTKIGQGAFELCASLTSVTLPDSVKSIGHFAFSECASLASVTIGKGVTSIGMEAFSGCPSLCSIALPISVTDIDIFAFDDCPALTLFGCPDSFAEKYALQNNIPFIPKHRYDDLTVTKQPTCTEDGAAIGACLCGDTTDILLPAPGHDLCEWYDPNGSNAMNAAQIRRCARCNMTETDGVTTQNYTLTLKNAANITTIRYAEGEYHLAGDIKRAPGCVTLNAAVISANLRGDTLVYDLPDGGIYSIWCRYSDGTERIFAPVDLTHMIQTVEANSAMFKLCNLYGVADFYLGKGTHYTYRDVKNSLILGVTNAKFGTKHTYAYGICLPGAGEYTVCVRYTDTSRPTEFIHFTVDVAEPEVTSVGESITISDLDGAKSIRIAPGEYTKLSDVKKAKGCIMYTGDVLAALLYGDTVTVTREPGTYTVAVQYVNGYTAIRNITIR